MAFDPTDTRVAITIPMPHYVPRPRGIHARTKFGGPMQVRASVAEKDVIRAAAIHLGITSAEFVRWLAVFGAKEVLRNVPEPAFPILSYVYTGEEQDQGPVPKPEPVE